MSQRISDKDLRQWHKSSAVLGSAVWPSSTVYPMADELIALRDENERLQEALWRIKKWSEAYPTDIFIEPDFAKAHEVLTAAGMTLDAISAHAMRHVVKGVGEIARAALKDAAQ